MRPDLLRQMELLSQAADVETKVLHQATNRHWEERGKRERRERKGFQKRLKAPASGERQQRQGRRQEEEQLKDSLERKAPKMATMKVADTVAAGLRAMNSIEWEVRML